MDPAVSIPLHFSLEMVGVAVTGLVGAWAILVRRWLVAAGGLAWAAVASLHVAGLLATEDHPLLVAVRLGSVALLVAGAIRLDLSPRVLGAGLAALAGGTVWAAVAGGEAADMSVGAHLVLLAGAAVVGWWVWGAARASVRLRVLAAFVAVLTVVVVIAGGAVTRVAALDERASRLDELGRQSAAASQRVLDDAAELADRARLLSPEIAPLVERDDPALEGREVAAGAWGLVLADDRATVIGGDGISPPYDASSAAGLSPVTAAWSGVVASGFDVTDAGLSVVAAAPVFVPGGEPVASDVMAVLVAGRTFGPRELGAGLPAGTEVAVVSGDVVVSVGGLDLGELELTEIEQGEVAQGREDRWLWSATGLPGPPTLVVSAPAAPVAEAATDLVRAFLVAILAAVALAVVAALWLSSRITRPMLAVAEEAERVKSDFLASVSHELRTPLTPIRGYTEILRRGRVPRRAAGTYLDEIGEAAERLERIVTLLVDVAAMEGGRFPLEAESVAARKLLQDAAERWSSSGAKVTVKVPKSLGGAEADAHQVARALDELMDNAVKFSPPGVEIELAGRKVGDEVELSVRDDGPGMAPDRIGALTDAFEQADRGDRRRFGGLGLGLAFVDGVARAHKGVLRIDSAPGKGTVCSFTLPVAVSVTSMRQKPRRTASRRSKAKTKAKGGSARRGA